MQAIRVVSIVGPTGCGKSAAALAVAGRVPAAVINCDSRQVYRELPILTAQPGPADRAVCPHLLYGFLSCREAMSAARFAGFAAEAVREAVGQGRLPLLVGGTGLYLRTLLLGIAPIPPVPAAVRAEVLERIAQLGPAAAHGLLAEVDPACAARIHPNDRQRIARALEVFAATGRPLSAWQAGQGEAPGFSCLKLGLRVGLAELVPQLARRIGEMLAAGVLAEVERASGACPDPAAPGLSAIGCRELLKHLAGRATLEQAREGWLAATRAYAKRQLTWFRKDAQIEWFAPDAVFALADRVQAWLAGG
jgi:tRNA dimethylallyltransferase